MLTTIRISKELQKALRKRKLYSKDSYEDIIWGLLENTMELPDETKRGIAKAEKQIADGKCYTLEQVKNELGLDV